MGKKENVSNTLTGQRPGTTTPRQSLEEQKYNNHSPPRTPPAQIGRPGKPRGGANAPRTRPSLQDAFGDDLKGGRNLHNRYRSNSHDLSWSPGNARGSVVDNMLLSLDNFGFASGSARGTTPSSTEDAQYASVQRFSTSNGRPRGHTTSSSISSDYSFHAESPPSLQTRGHRSNSSSNFQSSLGRIDSVRLAGDEKSGGADGYSEGSLATPGNLKRGNKNSAAPSLDYGQIIGGMAAAQQQHSRGERSASFDNGFHMPVPSNNAGAATAKHNVMSYGDFEAAPTPTVPGGPRKEYSPSRVAGFRPTPSLASTQPPPVRRRGSIRTPITLFGRNDRLDVPGGLNENQGTQGLTKSNSRSTDSSIPEPVTPNRGYTYPATIAASASSSKEKDRPGFFRRVFGSSKGTSTSINEATNTRKQGHSQGSTRAASRIGSVQTDDIANGASSTSSPQQPQSSQKSNGKEKSSSKDTPTLNKKTSFFRRRRKSIQDPNTVPLPQQAIPTHQNQYSETDNLVPPERIAPENLPDSPSSLRRVMDPYLAHHRRLESINSVDTHDSGRGNRVIPTTTAYSTIRTVTTTTNTVTSPKLTTTSNTTSGPSAAELEPAHASTGSERPEPVKRRFSSGEDRFIAGQASANRTEKEKPRHSSTHTRTQSDIDKDLPRLPVDYKAILYEAGREAPISETTQLNSSPAVQGKMGPDSADDSVRKGSVASPLLPERSSSRQQPSDKPNFNRSGSQEHTDQASDSTAGDYKSASSKPTSPVFSPPHDPHDADLADETLEAINFPLVDPSEPLPEHRAFAEKLFAGNANIDRNEVAPWLGEVAPDRTKIRRAYMELFDWKDMSILGALRAFCNSVQLKGETQQVDRVLDAISSRWCDCNPNHGFKATDVVHTICYSLLLLNTDLHLADIESKMTRTQFIRNTMPTIRRVVADAAPDAFDNARASMLPPPGRPQMLANQQSSNSRFSVISSEASEPAEVSRPTYRLSTRPSDHSGNDLIAIDDDCGPLVKTSFTGKLSSWELQVELVLKNFYNAIRQHRLPLSTGEEQRHMPDAYQSSASFSAMTGGMLRRTNSLLSKAGSETFPARGRMMGEGKSSSRWSSKARSRPRLYPASLAQSRTSVDEDQSAISPSMSSMWSKYSLGRTQTSMSANSFGSDFPVGDYQRSIGFANALSQAIIRDDPVADSMEELVKVGPLLEDESLELEGAPWAKEGILKHKHHLESVDKRAKDRSWSECFTVIEKGWIRLFQFNVNARSLRQKARNKGNPTGGGVVGGGNWMENAQSLGQFLLRHTIASALPPPGYSKARPHVWALSLPTGAVHLFQAGTPEIVKEYVSTANYWSARLSKEPLVGGVSNMEYGWSERVINMALIAPSSSDSNATRDNRPPSTLSNSTPMAPPRPSFQASIRSSIDANSSRPKLPGDRVFISEWSPPTQSMAASQLMEVDQLRALSTYVKNIEEELRKHNELRGPMLLAFTTRHPNHSKAMGNWERKSAYLLREIVKFSTYLESLAAASRERERVVAGREVREVKDEGEGMVDELRRGRKEITAGA